MNHLTRIIAPKLHAAGLDIREVQSVGGEVRELLVTNPRFPTWGRVTIDNDGSIEWDYWGSLADDAGAAQLAAVITAILAPRPGDDAASYGTRPTFQPAERDRPRS